MNKSRPFLHPPCSFEDKDTMGRHPDEAYLNPAMALAPHFNQVSYPNFEEVGEMELAGRRVISVKVEKKFLLEVNKVINGVVSLSLRFPITIKTPKVSTFCDLLFLAIFEQRR